MSCRICNSKNQIININGEDFYKCENCKFLERINILDEESEKARYDLHVCDNLYEDYMTKIYLEIKDYIVGEALDFGCGKTHSLSDILNQNNIKSDYYDYYYFKELKNKKYDTLILIEVIEHILDVNLLFEDFNKLLKDKGRLIIMTNFLVDNLKSWWYLRDKTHISIYNLESFRILAQKYNYKIIYTNSKNLIVLERI